MALSATQYYAVKRQFRAVLSGSPYGTKPNLSEADLLGFWAQLIVDSSGASGLGASQQNAVDAALRSALSPSVSVLPTLSGADWIDAISQLSAESSGATSLASAQYETLKRQLRALVSGRPGIPQNLSQSDLLSYFSPYASVPIPASLTTAGGGVAWWDFDAAFSGTSTDGGALTTFTNRVAGSDAVLAPIAGGTTSTYRATSLTTKTVKGSAYLRDAGLRATGASVTNMCNGLAKNNTWLLGWRPGATLSSTQYAAGFDKLGAASFTKCSSQLRKTAGGGQFWQVLTQAGLAFTDTAVIDQTMQILQVSRLNGNQLRVGINNVHTTVQSYGSGTTYDLDGWTIGGHVSSLMSGDALYQFAILIDHDIGANGVAENTALYSYLTSAYSGYEYIGSLGGT